MNIITTIKRKTSTSTSIWWLISKIVRQLDLADINYKFFFSYYVFIRLKFPAPCARYILDYRMGEFINFGTKISANINTFLESDSKNLPKDKLMSIDTTRQMN